jgi:acetoin utilization protein AcuB
MTKHLANEMVSEVMNPYLITVDPYQSLAEAYELMKKNHIRRLPVVKEGKLVGIITLADILNAKPSDVSHAMSFEKVAASLSQIIVELVMSDELVTIYQTDTLGHAAELMMENKIGGLPVLDARHELIGLITESDLFRKLAHQWRDDAREQSG